MLYSITELTDLSWGLTVILRICNYVKCNQIQSSLSKINIKFSRVGPPKVVLPIACVHGLSLVVANFNVVNANNSDVVYISFHILYYYS